ncbi:hypothetical protein KRR40_07180 [Niabella defluvii]|nr:hypothetical protein KRR40_07180 [Niabella sp. I65]
MPHQLEDVVKALPQYARHGKGRDDGSDKGEHSAIFYKKDKFLLLQSGDFWLSETPDKPGLGWDATCCNRICSWVYLQDQKSKRNSISLMFILIMRAKWLVLKAVNLYFKR